MRVKDLNVPDSVKEIILEEGIAGLYPPQEEAINAGVLEGENVVLAIPTASGKTLIAELCMVKSIIEKGGKAIYLVPLRALASEKYNDFKKYEKIGVKVAVSSGDYDSADPWLERQDLIISTNEKTDSLLRHRSRWINNLTVIVADETHLINDTSRGPTLEAVIAKLKQINPNAQILALSATISNAGEIAEWLDAKLVTSDWRPVELREGVYLRGGIEFNKGENTGLNPKYGNDVVDLVMDIVGKGGQALVFTGTRKSASSTASRIARALPELLTKNQKKTLKRISETILRQGEVTRMSRRLSELVLRGASFHHAGLRYTHRKIVEDCFRRNLLKAICATPTLCISKDSKIWHSTGETKVLEYDSTSPLFALKGNSLKQIKIQSIQRNFNSSKLIKITSVSGHSIKVTPNHKMLIKRNDVEHIVPASEIQIKDKIATIGRMALEGEDYPSVKDFILDNETEIPNLRIDTQLSYFIGLMLGDGYSGAATNGSKITYKGSAQITNTSKEILDSIKKTCEVFDIKCREDKNAYGTPVLVLTKAKWFREFLVRCGVEKGERKYIPQQFMFMGIKNVSSLLRGLFDTDGYVVKRKEVGFGNNSIRLIKQVQKLLLRFGIVSRIRKKKPGSMSIGDKTYDTKASYELIIANKNCILEYNRKIGFGIKAKSKDLDELVSKIRKNVYFSFCKKCGYRIYRGIFQGKTPAKKTWGKQKLEVIRFLGEEGELGSRKIRNKLGFEPKKKVSRLNHHYEFIQKRRIGEFSPTEWYWSLNSIGKWVYENILKSKDDLDDFFKLKECPLCGESLGHQIKKGWRHSDLEGDIYWDFVKDIQEVPAESEVYDVVLPNSPENDHMFVCNGFIVHNSAGINVPARRVIIGSYRRYEGGIGYYPIPVLEYKQMAGRAGRPKYDTEGEAVLLAKTENEKEFVMRNYVFGNPEKIWSKLASEGALRTHILALIATGFAKDEKGLLEFINHTFYAHQYDPKDILEVVERIRQFLIEEEMIYHRNGRLSATRFGHRVSELYVDPKSGVIIKNALLSASNKETTPLSFMHLICHTPNMPNLYLRKKDYQELDVFTDEHFDEFIVELPDQWLEPHAYEFFLSEVKVAKLLLEWTNETSEDLLTRRFDIGSGDIFRFVETADWLLYSTYEIGKLFKIRELTPQINRTRVCVKNGVKEELLDLVKLRGIGRVRARMLFNAGFEDVKALKRAKLQQLTGIPLIGKEIAKKIKEQVGGVLTQKEWKELSSERTDEADQKVLSEFEE